MDAVGSTCFGRILSIDSSTCLLQGEGRKRLLIRVEPVVRQGVGFLGGEVSRP
ncbi:hypothetical protein BAUCODRAFT_39886 [Baudoinia panamericana UAMH 10762]|uniref:Uncharacterized protein n=1 Tax=Baudoinia panamericana (strain UAMH 10762) TaxID=717646 RepID=M2MWC0_BAUPA|nr:uncharacterized protein BAUCODRAFT_39886 [Baudoinia panamericana UAMH 10762]EMC90879.1 hypothetical protein BAUCODRAFT_39886 [Baudoinia panamericana UAMH 10762]